MNVPNEFTEFFQGIDLTKREIAFLIWLTEWDQNTIRNMRTVLEKVRAAGVADGAIPQPSNEPLTMEDAKKERYIWFTPLNDWAKVTPFGVLFFGSEELMTWETLCEEWGYRFKAYRRPPEGEA